MNIMRNQCGPLDLTKGEDITRGFGGEGPAAIGKGGLGAEPPAVNGFLRFSRKNTRFGTFFYPKGHTGVLQ